ncbi:MAG: hypothetical protein A3J24_08875 [Deltaproteobacteria bacterium RIFCSPLOWO2_02_FULL_53_8]|nr:MAG: hypothetical protein A3J24_08875 [Deltaproteobacteria bacterium RIFCSPLOWO2_02_FULL_53_8]
MAIDDFDMDARMPRPRIFLPAVLLAVTVVTTITAGALYRGADVWGHPATLVLGIPFSAALLFVLGTHELAHFFAARRHGVYTTLPTFIPGPPFPPLIGTFGAVIRIKSPITTRAALVDIGVSGPLCGFAAALVVMIIGLFLSRPVPYVASIAGGEEQLGLGASLLFKLLSAVIIGEVPANHELLLHPIAFAAWIGMFVTAMNLLPIGQLDGGHLVYALIGPRHRYFSMFVVACLVVLGYFTWPGWFLWAFLTSIIGLRHPPVYDEGAPIDRRTWLLTAASLAVFVLTFMPTPFYIV